MSSEAGKRHAILRDATLWLRLEFGLSGWFSESPEQAHRKYWIDGFEPRTVTDTRYGADFAGEVWLATHQGAQTKAGFVVSVPQALLYDPAISHTISEVSIDESRRDLRVVIGE